MCDFHSIIGVAIGNRYEIRHDPSNSHDKIARGLRNLPNRQPVMFEAEWRGEGWIPGASAIIRNYSECPQKMADKIMAHYEKLTEALKTGKHLCPGSYFGDTEKWRDVWEHAIRLGAPVKVPKVFNGNVTIRPNYKVDLSELTELRGSLNILDCEVKLPALKKVLGRVDITRGGLVAPRLTMVRNTVVINEASVNAPALSRLDSSLYIYAKTRVALPALKRIGWSLCVENQSKATVPALKVVTCGVTVRCHAMLNAPALERAESLVCSSPVTLPALKKVTAISLYSPGALTARALTGKPTYVGSGKLIAPKLTK